MQDFGIYLGLGFGHITDVGGYDHMLFLLALCATFTLREWRRVLVLVTAFTLGHSLTLALSVAGGPLVPTRIVEFLIPVTILLTALWNVRRRDAASPVRLYVHYGMALGFGLIHGMGFSNYLRALLGQEASVAGPLLAFNVGLELGQVLVVGLILGTGFVFLDHLRTPRRDWTVFISGAAAGISLILLFENKIW